MDHSTGLTGKPRLIFRGQQRDTGAVFIGGTDGKVHALASADGHELWSFDTAREFTTVNQVAAHSWAIGSIGPTIVGGTLLIGSGYSVTSGIPGNVLLAFAP